MSLHITPDNEEIRNCTANDSFSATFEESKRQGILMAPDPESEYVTLFIEVKNPQSVANYVGKLLRTYNQSEQMNFFGYLSAAMNGGVELDGMAVLGEAMEGEDKECGNCDCTVSEGCKNGGQE